MIGVVVPSIRDEQLKLFLEAWSPLFEKHAVSLYVVLDGKTPRVNGETAKEVMGKCSDLIYNFSDSVRNLGFAKAYMDGCDIIISLDDDTRPYGDTIQDHLDVLGKRFPISWTNTTDDVYMRGFPYKIRDEAECVFSHGVWEGVYDLDASTQLVMGTVTPQHRKMPIPKGALFPVCVMNVAFTREVLPYYYQAPAFDKYQRFSDIFAGIEMKKAIDKLGLCAVTGYAKVRHERASNPFVNLEKEAHCLGLNENYGKGEYFDLFRYQTKRWQKFLCKA